MSQDNVEVARRGYAALNAAYKSGDVQDLLPFAEETWDPEIVLKPSGAFVEGATERHGYEGMLGFVALQMEAFREMWIEPQEFIEVGDRLVVLFRFGGKARQTGIELEFSFAHVLTMREDKVVRMEIHETKDKALEAAGLQE